MVAIITSDQLRTIQSSTKYSSIKQEQIGNDENDNLTLYGTKQVIYIVEMLYYIERLPKRVDRSDGVYDINNCVVWVYAQCLTMRKLHNFMNIYHERSLLASLAPTSEHPEFTIEAKFYMLHKTDRINDQDFHTKIVSY